MCSDDSLRCSLDAMGAENVMFSIDYPFEKTELAARFIETAKVTEAERAPGSLDQCHAHPSS
jgi:2,3-dihydroxybenzoate decarboxylase